MESQIDFCDLLGKLDILKEKKRTNLRFVMPEQLLRDTLRKINEALMEGFPVPHPTWKEVCEADELTQKASEETEFQEWESTQTEESQTTRVFNQYEEEDEPETESERKYMIHVRPNKAKIATQKAKYQEHHPKC
jgi:hypothetical protein